MKRILPWLALIVVAGTTGGILLARREGFPPGLFGARPAPAGTSQAPAEPVAVVALGRIEPAGGLVALNAPPGAAIETILVREGDEVAKDQELVILAGHRERTIERARIAAQLEEAQHQRATQQEELDHLVPDAEAEKEEIADRADFEERELAAKIDLLEQKRQNSAKDLKRLEELRRVTSDVVFEQQLERQKLLARDDEEELALARQRLARLKKDRTQQIRKVEQELARSQRAGRRAQAAIPDKSLKEGLRLADELLRQTTLRAPIAGRILKILAHEGEITGPRPVLQLGNTRELEAVAEVYEDDIARVAPGQRAEVRVPATGAVASGVVRSIGLTVAKNDVLNLDPAAAAYARVVEVRIGLDGPQPDLRCYQQVNVTIRTGPPAVARAAGSGGPAR